MQFIAIAIYVQKKSDYQYKFVYTSNEGKDKPRSAVFLCVLLFV